jgi:hypothetical protein
LAGLVLLWGIMKSIAWDRNWIHCVEKGIWQRDASWVKLSAAPYTEGRYASEIPDGGCLRCSEEKPHHCHRRLVAEYLKGHWQDVEIEHIP